MVQDHWHPTAFLKQICKLFDLEIGYKRRHDHAPARPIHDTGHADDDAVDAAGNVSPLSFGDFRHEFDRVALTKLFRRDNYLKHHVAAAVDNHGDKFRSANVKGQYMDIRHFGAR